MKLHKTAIMLRSFAILVIVYYTSVESFMHQYPKITSGNYKGDDDPGEPLFLTPYVENGDIKTGRKLASVPSDQWFGIKSYSGFLTVDKDHGSNHFFWYFPAMNDARQAPVILWLNGGPGASSLYGAFIENGPLSVFDGKILNRKYNWAFYHHLIYVDQPVGTGFSFTNSSEGYCTNQEQIGAQLYSTMTQFFQLFPELQKKDFFIVGESYAGKYGTTLAYVIHKKNPEAKVKINLKGVAVGNGYCDPEHQLGYDEYLYQLGLIDNSQKEAMYKVRKDTEAMIRQKDWGRAFDHINKLMSMTGYYTGLSSMYNFLHVKQDSINDKREDFGIILQQGAVRKLIHVGKLTYDELNLDVYDNLILDFPQSVAPLISELLDYYEFAFYNGQLDIIVAYPLTANFLSNLKFSDRDKYLNGTRCYFAIDDDIVAWTKQGGKLMDVMIRNAGHMVPKDQPLWAWYMIFIFTHSTFMADNDTCGETLDITPFNNHTITFRKLKP